MYSLMTFDQKRGLGAGGDERGGGGGDGSLHIKLCFWEEFPILNEAIFNNL